MHKMSNSELLLFDPKIERTLCRLKNIKVDNTKIEDQNTDTIKTNGVDHNVIKLKLFPFSLRDKARNWFNNLMSGSIDT